MRRREGGRGEEEEEEEEEKEVGCERKTEPSPRGEENKLCFGIPHPFEHVSY